MACRPRTPPRTSKPPGWERWSQDDTLFARAVEHGPGAVGVALAESHPALVPVLHLEGGTDACRLLLERLVRMAGERDIFVWCPDASAERQQGHAP